MCFFSDRVVVWRKAKVTAIEKMTQSYCSSPTTVDKMCVCACVRMCACVHVFVHVCVFVHACMRVHVHVCVPLYMDSHSLSEKPLSSQALPIGDFSCPVLLNDEREHSHPFAWVSVSNCRNIITTNSPW